MDLERREERMSCMERVTWKLTSPYVKQIANGNLLYASGISKSVCRPHLEGWDGKEDGREVQKEGDICIPVADSC